MTDHGPAVRLSGVERKFGDAYALRGIDLDIADGEFFSLIGPSGCGKTTTLRLVSGLDNPTAGRVEVHGQPMMGGYASPVMDDGRVVHAGAMRALADDAALQHALLGLAL